jgi:hypothetical protein
MVFGWDVPPLRAQVAAPATGKITIVAFPEEGERST